MNFKRNPAFERAAVVLWMALVALRYPGLWFIEARGSATPQLLTSSFWHFFHRVTLTSNRGCRAGRCGRVGGLCNLFKEIVSYQILKPTGYVQNPLAAASERLKPALANFHFQSLEPGP
jgi:hypothetical protein